MNTVLFGAAECAKCCPPHAIAALAGTAVVGFLAGFFVGRRGKSDKKGPGPKKQPPSQPRRPMRPPEPRTPIPAGSVEIYVGNLSYGMTEPELRKTFEAFVIVGEKLTEFDIDCRCVWLAHHLPVMEVRERRHGIFGHAVVRFGFVAYTDADLV